MAFVQIMEFRTSDIVIPAGGRDGFPDRSKAIA